MLEDILLQVNKPGRYIGREWNVAKKDFDQANIKFALCFPDLYEVGMSNLGFRILYGILNDIEDVCCQRFFATDLDMQRLLRKNNLESFSLESKRRLKEFDLVGFSLSYELDYTNVLNILELGKIPLNSSLRDSSYPLVIGGGPCTVNPEPMHSFFDLFVIGEAEDAILEIINVYRDFKHKFKTAQIDKQDLLIMLSKIQGIYVPSLYEAVYNDEGKIKEFQPRIKSIPAKIKKRFVKDLNKAYFPLDWLIPYIQVTHDRISLEIMRGCPNSCRFCQARSQYYPFRKRNIKNILTLACDVYKRTGYEEISLAGLSISDYPDIEVLIKHLVDLFKEKALGISLPSLRAKTMVGDLSALISTIKKTGLTFAPEAATERLRKIIAKDFNILDFFKVIEQAYSSGWQHIKLYFLIGLPYEEDADLDAIIELANQVSQLRKTINQRPAQINISINALIPKPHTPLQWYKMVDIDTIKHKQEYLKSKVRKYLTCSGRSERLRLGFHSRYMSFLEAVFSRGDRRLAPVIEGAFRKGAQFDAWGNYFAFDKWIDAFAESKIDPNFYLQERSKVELLPWDFLDIGISKKVLMEEANKIDSDSIH